MLIVSIIAFGMWKKIPVYDSFVEGAEAGMKTVLHLIPTMIGLMLATGVLRASGFLDLIAHLLEQAAGDSPFPACLFPMAVLRLFSSSAATGLLLDVYQCIFPERERKKDTVYASGCAFCDRVWDRGERRAGWMDMRIIGIEVMIRNC